MRRSPAGAALAVLLAAASPAAPPAAAHVVYGRPSLAALVAGAEVVVRGRIERGAEAVAVGDSGERRPVVTAELLEPLKGDPGPGPLRFAQHGHGVAEFAPGDEVLLFLQPIERSRELEALAGSGLRWVSLQEHGAELALTDASRAAFVEAVRGYAAAQAGPESEDSGPENPDPGPEKPDPAAALAAGRDVTFRLLRSPERRLAEMALRDLVLRSEALLTPGSLPVLEPLVDDPAVPIGIRLGVLAELDRRGLLAGGPRWAALLASAEPPDLLAVVRAAGAHPGPGVNRELIRLLRAADPETAEAAAIALGVPGNDPAVAPLAAVLRDGPPPLAMAAIRGLGGIASPAALAALAEAARDHPEAAVRRRAGAEVRRLGAR